MGKRLEDLNLTDQPFPVPSSPSGPDADPRGTAWYQFATEIDDLLATGSFTWAEQTLRDIQRTVTDHKIVTEGQRKAIANIEAAREGSRRRRYEGFSRRWR